MAAGLTAAAYCGRLLSRAERVFLRRCGLNENIQRAKSRLFLTLIECTSICLCRMHYHRNTISQQLIRSTMVVHIIVAKGDVMLAMSTQLANYCVVQNVMRNVFLQRIEVKGRGAEAQNGGTRLAS